VSEIELFTFKDHQVRTLLIDGVPWFLAVDVCAICALKDTSSALRKVDDRDVRRLRRSDTPHLFLGIAPQVQEVTVVNESGLYDLVFQSQKDEAREFKRWVTSDLLPRYRRGELAVAPAFDPASLSRLDILKLAMQAEEEKAVLEAALESAAPAIEHYDRYVSEDDVMLVKDWANLFGLSDPAGRQLLLDKNIIYRKLVTRRFSGKAARHVDVFEWRAYADRVTFAWFDLRPQERVERYHNGQLRQTLYVRRVFALELGRKVGLTQPQIPGIDVAVTSESGDAA
jgi:prophage antirepressor-like protein